MSAFSRLKALDEIKTAIELIRACVGMGKGQWFSQNRTFSLLSSNASLFCNPSYSLLTVCFILHQYPFLSFQVRLFKVHKYTYASFIKEWNQCFHLMDCITYWKHLFTILMNITIILYAFVNPYIYILWNWWQRILQHAILCF